MTHTTKAILIYSFELAVAAFALWLNQSLFFLYAFISLIFAVDSKFNRMRRLVRVFQVANETKLLAIARKVGVTPEDFEAIGAEVEAQLSPEQRKDLEADLNAVLG